MSKIALAGDLIASIATILIASGSSEKEAHTVASNLVMANLSGHDSHGVGMLPRYVAAVLEGGLKPNTSVKTLLDLGHMLTLDGQRGYGQVIGEQAMQMGIERAKQHGSCIMTLSNSHHLGRIGHWAEMATNSGLVSMHFVNVMARPSVAPWGGADGRFGTNPCCIGIPLAGREPFLLDFATSRVAQGKMRVAYNEGHSVAPGLLIDETGAPTVNPGVVVVPQTKPGTTASGGGLFGALLTFGEHKGYGMAVACELLGGALTGGGSWHEPANSPRGQQQAVLNGMLTVLIDPAKLGTQTSFESEAQAFVDWVKQSPAGQGSESEFKGVQIAGDPERRARVQRAKDGIVIDDQTWADIVDAGVKVGINAV
jgi:hydroxycarboxylate dehydrogenase B